MRGLRHLGLIVLMGIVAVPILWMSGPKDEGAGIAVLMHGPVFVKKYQRERVFAMFKHDPKTLRESAYQTQHAMTAFASGRSPAKARA